MSNVLDTMIATLQDQRQRIDRAIDALSGLQASAPKPEFIANGPVDTAPAKRFISLATRKKMAAAQRARHKREAAEARRRG